MLTIYVGSNWRIIQSVCPVFHVLFAVAVLSGVHSTTFAPVYKVTGRTNGSHSGYTSDCCQTLSPLINNVGITSLMQVCLHLYQF